MTQQTLFDIEQENIKKGDVVVHRKGEEELVVVKTYDHCRTGEWMALWVPKWVWDKGRTNINGCTPTKDLKRVT